MEARQEVYRLFHLLHQLCVVHVCVLVVWTRKLPTPHTPHPTPLKNSNNNGAGFGSGGTAANPKGYLERCVQLIRSISSR